MCPEDQEEAEEHPVKSALVGVRVHREPHGATMRLRMSVTGTSRARAHRGRPGAAIREEGAREWGYIVKPNTSGACTGTHTDLQVRDLVWSVSLDV